MVNQWLYLVLITLMPGIELRGSIPYGIFQTEFNPVNVFVVAVFTNILVIYPSFVFLDWFFDLLMRFKPTEKYIKKTRGKAQRYVERYGTLGLAVFVAVPLPGTGAYTGALAAHVFGMKNGRAYLAICVGVFSAGLLVFLISTVFRGTLGWVLGL